MVEKDMVAVFLDLRLELADAALKAELVQVLLLVMFNLHVIHRGVFVVGSELTQVAMITEPEMIIVHMFLQLLVGLLI